MTTVQLLDDPTTFLDVASAYLAAQPVLTTVLASTTRARADDLAAGRPRPSHPLWWAVVRDDDGAVVGLAMRTAPFAPYPLYLLPMADEAAVALARAVHARADDVAAATANGASAAVRALAGELARLAGTTTTSGRVSRLFELTDADLQRPTAGRTPGRLRVAEQTDVDLAHAWLSTFHATADEQVGRPHDPRQDAHVDRADVEQRVGEGRVWLWEDDGEVVHLTAHTRPAFDVVRLGPVLTPTEHRGRGYAGAAVAAVSARVLGAGHRVCLFADAENEVSNRLYAAIGYRHVVDMASISW